MVRELDLGAGWIGVIFAIGSLGFVVGALIAGRVIRLLGPLVALAVGSSPPAPPTHSSW